GSGELAELTSTTAVERSGTAPLPPALAVTLPAASAVSLEPQEAMRVIFPQTLTVTSNSGGGATDGFAQFGELLLSSGGPQLTPTEWIDPNDDPASGTTTSGNSNVPAIRAQERQAPLRTILLDDGSTATFPFPMPHLSGEGTRRCGDTVTDLTGILAYNFNAWRIQPTDPIPWVDANPRPAQPPDVGGRLRVASMNVLNYFTTFGGSNDRGASSAEEFARQKAKIIAALAGLDAHIIGLMEIQNSPSAISDLLSGLNDAVTDDYAVVADPPGGYPLAGTNADFIRCLLIYRPSRITPRGDCQMDTDGVWFVATPTAQEPDKRNPLRFPLAQVFEENDSGERFSVCVNHWKSKSSIDATGLNLNQNDGQAAFNHLRRQQAARLDAWLQGVAAITGEPDVLIIGDLNSYGEEDPLDTLRAAGWQDQGQRFQGVGDYSYRLGGQRGRLDHAFASASMAAQITGQDHWHINADEPAFLDYNVENKKPGHLPMNLGTPYRSSDHDPVLIGIRLNVPEVDYAAWQASRTWQPGNSPLPEEDPDGDGLVNLAEFAMNLDPESPSGGSQWLEIIPHPDGLRVRHRRHLQALGVQIIAEWSPDLEHWTPLVAAPNITPLDARTESLQYDLPVDTEAPRGFTRLRFETTP
ncbi:MAG: ExeM/NucH family extracellular endonuclease, partial [Prosthecobacter sp.]|nr:ExeM/NucH family extracellular endonuclease [Prosthecobacter sp.]